MYSNNENVLVVEDDAAVQQLTMRALNEQGFHCSSASDGEEALAMLESSDYSVVVTDLKMPNMHGHALAVDLLARDDCPLLVVLTGVLEPRLAKDLMARGVDDIMFKPVDYKIFAAKVRSLVNRRGLYPPVKLPAKQAATSVAKEITMDEIESKLSIVSRIVPISETALQVYEMTNTGQCSAEQLADPIRCDGPLATEIIGLANSSFYNPNGKPITEIGLAVARIGQKRVGEIALAASALSALTTRLLPWMDVRAAWRRSVAAGIALDLLVKEGQHEDIDEGLVLCAIMHQLGRVVLGTLYPNHYQHMIATCLESNATLLECENQLFPHNHAKIISRLAAIWKIPAEICRPLRNMLDAYVALSRFPAVMRSKIELVKLAVLVGQMATHHWESWDLVEFPQSSLLKRLGVVDLTSIVEQTKTDLQRVMEAQSKTTGHNESDTSIAEDGKDRRQLYYSNLSTDSVDFLQNIVSSMNMALVPLAGDVENCNGTILFNCSQAPPHRLSTVLQSPRDGKHVLACHQDQIEQLKNVGTAIAIPCSYGALKSCLWKAAEKQQGHSLNSTYVPMI